ncbi:MAG: hypothetical protein GXY19_18710 [Phycisphaerae bacterium]|nr:hypothetical protein [Phycisphaerae bacterium]
MATAKQLGILMEDDEIRGMTLCGRLAMRLTCYYCGAEISTEAGQIGTLIVCPGCGHRVRVPRPGLADASPPQADRRSSAVRKDAAAWEHLSNQEIRDTVLYEALPRAEKLRVNLKRAFAFVLPRYDDLTLFAFGIAFVLLVLLDPGLRGAMAAIGTDPHSETETLLLGFAGLGLTLSLIGVVWPREKSEFEKVMMLFFAILITIGAGVSTWRTPGAGALGWLAVFPIWNQFNAVLLLLLASTGILDTDCITDRRATARQIVVAVATIAVVTAVCRHFFRLHWAVTYSIAVNYTLSFLGRVQKFFDAPPASA